MKHIEGVACKLDSPGLQAMKNAFKTVKGNGDPCVDHPGVRQHV
jgi:hypothetical protein